MPTTTPSPASCRYWSARFVRSTFGSLMTGTLPASTASITRGCGADACGGTCASRYRQPTTNPAASTVARIQAMSFPFIIDAQAGTDTIVASFIRQTYAFCKGQRIQAAPVRRDAHRDLPEDHRDPPRQALRGIREQDEGSGRG